jgi:hypothetical protein
MKWAGYRLQDNRKMLLKKLNHISHFFSSAFTIINYRWRIAGKYP